MRNPIRSQDPDAIGQLKKKIEAAEKLQAVMKAANRIVRDSTLNENQKVIRLAADCRIDEGRALQLLQPDYAGRSGFPSYELTNNTANIRRMQERVKALEREGARASVTVEFPGGRMEDNAEECRVRIYHDAKPGKDVIEKLKGSGFHWTPSLQCWQRLRNDSARWAATRVTGFSWPDAKALEAEAQGPTVRTEAAEEPPKQGMRA